MKNPHEIDQRCRSAYARGMISLSDISPELPVLIAGATASGKSALALEIAASGGGVIVNADALQIYDCWRILSARPSIEEETQAPHFLYGHVDYRHNYSVGEWLRDVQTLLSDRNLRPIIVGGTGLYFRALTEGLADIPATPPSIRAEADAIIRDGGLQNMLSELDTATLNRIDTLNPVRVQRAWEVMRSTGRGLAAWQDDTPPPLLPLTSCYPLVLDADKDWLNDRIALRFEKMIDMGALDEVRAMLPDWDPSRLSAKAIGAPELIAHLKGELTLSEAIEDSIIASRQYAKRQRTWFRARMKDWNHVTLS